MPRHLASLDPKGRNETFAWRPKMIVFDKDGTLGDCTHALHNWSKRMTYEVIKECQALNIHQNTIDDLVYKFHDAIGWDAHKESLLPSSLLSSGTWEQVLEASTVAIEGTGTEVGGEGNGNECVIPDLRGKISYWHNHLGDIHGDDRPLIDDLSGFIQGLKKEGFIISICTSDDRNATDCCIRNWGLEGLIDFSICGDEVFEGKPSAQPLLTLCKRAQVTPRDCIVVGDTSADTMMGRNADAGLTVGVLTGTGTADYLLEHGAHCILPNVTYLSRLVCGRNGTSRDNNLRSPPGNEGALLWSALKS